MKTLKLSILLLLACNYTFGQSDPQFTLFDNNLTLFNPGVTGLKNKVNVASNARNQWAGLDGAPLSITLNADVKLKKKFGGFGIAYLFDKIGLETKNKAYLNYAYQVIKNKYRIGFGLGFNMTLARLEGSVLAGVTTDPNLISFQSQKSTFLDANAGIYLAHEKYEIGVGLTHFNLAGKTGFLKPQSEIMYVNAAYLIETGTSTKWRISSLLKTNFVSSTTIEVQGIATIKEKVQLGLGARDNKAFSAIVGYKLFNKLQLNYVYEHTFGRIGFEHTHEVALSFIIPN